MPINERQNDLYKELTYPLCHFLIERRLQRQGKGRFYPVDVPLTDIEGFLDHVFSGSSERLAHKWELLKNELEALADECDPSGNNCLLKIESPGVLQTLSENRTSTENVLRLRYSREAIEEYVRYLERGDRQIDEQRGGIKASLPTIDVRSVLWTHKGRTMRIRSRGDKNVSINLCLLLYGMGQLINGVLQTATIREYEPTGFEAEAVSNYRIGDAVHIELLAQMLFPDEWVDETRRQGLRKKIDSAFRGLNKRAKQKFGINFDVFELSPGEVKVSGR